MCGRSSRALAGRGAGLERRCSMGLSASARDPRAWTRPPHRGGTCAAPWGPYGGRRCAPHWAPTLGRLHTVLNQGGEPSGAGASVWGPLGKMKISCVSCHVGLELGQVRRSGQVLRTLPPPPQQRPRQLHGEEVLPLELEGAHGSCEQRLESRALCGVGAQLGCPCSALRERQCDAAHSLLLPTPGCPPVPRHTDAGKSGWARVIAALCPEGPCHLASEAASS